MFEAQIADRQQELRSELSISYSQGQALQRQLKGAARSLGLIRQIASQKAEAAFSRRDSVDNLIDAQKEALQAETDLFALQRDLLEVVVEIEAVTGVYFTRLALELNDPQADPAPSRASASTTE